MLTTLEVLRSARKLLSDPKRWGKGQFSQPNDDGETCYCAMGAIYAAAGYETQGTLVPGDPVGASIVTKPYFDALRPHIDESRKTYLAGIPDWNDHPDTTYEEVMSAFSAACEAEFAKTQAEQEVAVS